MDITIDQNQYSQSAHVYFYLLMYIPAICMYNHKFFKKITFSDGISIVGISKNKHYILGVL